MKVYLVGGPVRDELLGHPPEDRDYVVVGASPQIMIDKGFIPVGKSFPVFLHPETKEQYALARLEKKVAPGHQGFEFVFTPEISLEQDLWRRDFTINAMAKDLETGDIIDPYGGRADLKKKILRHVSQHFAEDPLRIFRGIRFAAKFNLSIDAQTIKLMEKMVNEREWHKLSWDRMIIELEKGIALPHFKKYFKLMSFFKIWKGQRPKWHKWFSQKKSTKRDLEWKKVLAVIAKLKRKNMPFTRELLWSFFFINSSDFKVSGLPLPSIIFDVINFYQILNKKLFSKKNDLLVLNRLRWGQREEVINFLDIIISCKNDLHVIKRWNFLKKCIHKYKHESLKRKKNGIILDKKTSDQLKLKLTSHKFFQNL